MAVLLFNLHNVPQDEADEVRQLLQENRLDTYETTSGRWKSGVAAIWLADQNQLPQARALLDAYQAERVARIRREYEELRAAGKAPTFRNNLARKPLLVTASLVAAGILVGLMILPFVGFLG